MGILISGRGWAHRRTFETGGVKRNRC